MGANRELWDRMGANQDSRFQKLRQFQLLDRTANQDSNTILKNKLKCNKNFMSINNKCNNTSKSRTVFE